MINRNREYENIISIVKLNIAKIREEDKNLLYCINHSICKEGIFKARIINLAARQCWMELEDTKLLVCIPTNIIEYIFPSLDYKKEYDAALIEIRKEKNNNDD